MIADIKTVVWKEIRSLFTWRTDFLKDTVPLLVIIAVFGVVFPLQVGREFLDLPWGATPWLWLPIMMTTSTVADSIAGERERHTLETLLASRLSDTAILIGKVIAAVAYGLILAAASALTAAVVVNLSNPGDGLAFYDPLLLAALITAAVLIALFVASLAAVVATFLSNMRQAGQTVGGILIFVMVSFFFLIQALPPAWQEAIAGVLGALEALQVAAIAAIVMAVLDAFLLYLASLRFRRDRLVLD